MNKRNHYLGLLALVAAAIIFGAIMVFAPNGKVTNTSPKTSENNIVYSIIEIEGMPCLLVQSITYPSNYVKSVTCDWSKWDGAK